MTGTTADHTTGTGGNALTLSVKMILRTAKALYDGVASFLPEHHVATAEYATLGFVRTTLALVGEHAWTKSS
jgi:hypothetical protein